MNIHPLAIVSPRAELGKNVEIGPLAIIEEGVRLGDGCQVASHAVIKRGVTLGANNKVCESAVIGGFAQHLAAPEKMGELVVGANNTIREHCTLHRALREGATTTVGDNNLLMVGAHVAHDCRVGNNVILANNALLAGHVIVEDRAFVSGAVAVHQFCRIGQLAMVGGHARVVQDVPPYMMVDGVSGCIVGLNLVGLRRSGMTNEQIAELKTAYRVIYRRSLHWAEVLAELKNQFTAGPASRFHEFLSQGTRGFVQERRMPPTATLKLRRAPEEDERQLRARAG